MADLLSGLTPYDENLADGAVLLRDFARAQGPVLMAAIEAVAATAPFRHMVVPGGHLMSVAMTNCGSLGWITDPSGYRYTRDDPVSGRPWPAMAACLGEIATSAAAAAGFRCVSFDACLINRYAPGARMGLHQDRNERDMAAPIVSVSLGLPAVFLFGGAKRRDPVRRMRIDHGDIVVWAGRAGSFFTASPR